MVHLLFWEASQPWHTGDMTRLLEIADLITHFQIPPSTEEPIRETFGPTRTLPERILCHSLHATHLCILPDV